MVVPGVAVLKVSITLEAKNWRLEE